MHIRYLSDSSVGNYVAAKSGDWCGDVSAIYFDSTDHSAYFYNQSMYYLVYEKIAAVKRTDIAFESMTGLHIPHGFAYT